MLTSGFRTSLSLLIASLVLLIIGNGLLTTLSPLYLQHYHFSTNAISLTAFANAAGQITGALYSKKLIKSLGYTKAFSLFTLVLAMIAFWQGLQLKLWVWLLARGLNGYCTSGIYIIIESGLLAASNPQNRNRILAVYMASFYAATAAGQFLLPLINLWSLQPFIIIVLLSLAAIIPIQFIHITKAQLTQTTYLSFKKLFNISRLGLLSCLISGLITGIFYSFAPIVIQQNHAALNETANFMGMAILGGMMGQWPIGLLADKTNRYKVLTSIAFITTICCGLLIHNNIYSSFMLNGLGFIFGCCAFTLYPLSIGCAIKHIAPQDYIAAISSFLLVYSFGAMLSPLFASPSIKIFGYAGVFGCAAGLGMMMFLLLIASRKK